MAGKRVRSGAALSAALIDIGKKFEKEDLDPILQKLSLDGFRYLVRRTPIRTGFLASKWAVAINASINQQLYKNPGGSYSPAQPPSITRSIEWGDKVTLYNNTEYAYFVDTGTGKNRTAQPMIEPTYIYLENVARRLVDAKNRKRIE